MQEQLNDLFSEAVNLAESFLQVNQEFYPFAVALSPEHELVHVQVLMDDTMPQSADVISVLQKGLSNGVIDGRYVSTAVVTDVKLRDRETGECHDAIRVDIEDQITAPITCYVPYVIDESAIRTMDVIRVSGDSIIFSGS